MNRRDRRAAEAKERKLFGARELELARRAPPGTVPPSMRADFFKGIALQVRALNFVGLSDIGGRCIFRTLAAYQAVRASSIEATISFGGLVVRVGPDERHDVVAFCGPRNMGCIAPSGHAAFHCWLRYADNEMWNFDPSVGEWSAIDAVSTEQEVFGTALPPPQWTIKLPDYWLKSATEVEFAWRPEGTPALGQAWYGPFYGDSAAVMQRIRSVHEDVGQQIASGLAKIVDAYCDRQGIDRRGDDRVYPLKFYAVSAEPMAKNSGTEEPDPLQ